MNEEKTVPEHNQSFHLYTDREIETMHVTAEEMHRVAMQMAKWIDEEMEKRFEE